MYTKEIDYMAGVYASAFALQQISDQIRAQAADYRANLELAKLRPKPGFDATEITIGLTNMQQDFTGYRAEIARLTNMETFEDFTDALNSLSHHLELITTIESRIQMEDIQLAMYEESGTTPVDLREADVFEPVELREKAKRLREQLAALIQSGMAVAKSLELSPPSDLTVVRSSVTP